MNLRKRFIMKRIAKRRRERAKPAQVSVTVFDGFVNPNIFLSETVREFGVPKDVMNASDHHTATAESLI